MAKRTGWNVPKIWEGEDCYIIGGGPSWLTQFKIPQNVIDNVRDKTKKMKAFSPYLKFLHDKRVIGVNGAFQLGPWVSICAFMDEDTFEEHEIELMTKFRGLKVTTNDNIMHKKYIKHFIKFLQKEPNKQHGISDLPGSHGGNGNSGAFAINVAHKLGVKRIFLFGFDMNMTNGYSHFHNDYPGPWKPDIPATHLRDFPDIAKDAKRLGLQIYNVNPNSSIEQFPKITLQELKKIVKE